MEIQLSEKQIQIIQSTIVEQEQLRAQAQTEFNKLQKRLDDVVAVVLDSKGIEMIQGIKYENGKLIIPDAPESEPKDAPGFIPEKKKKAK